MKTQNKTHVLHPSLYHISLVGHQLIYMRWNEFIKAGLFTVKTPVTLLKIIFEFMFNGLDQHYTGSAGRIARENALNEILSHYT